MAEPASASASVPASVARIIVAGVGNVLHQDDGFGVEVVKALAAQIGHAPLPPGVELMDIGIGGMNLVQALEDRCDLLVIIDAVQRGGTPGTLYTLEPEVPKLDKMSLHEARDYLADTHYATPMRALAFAHSLGRSPLQVRIVGCEPVEADDIGIGLNGPVANAVDQACQRVRALVGARASIDPHRLE